jgi:hypothetical protein
MGNIIISMFLVLTLGGCSVYMAAKKSGVEVSQILECKTKGCLQGLSTSQIIESKPVAEGSAPAGGSVDTWRVQMRKGSSARAAMHGVLDVFTLGIWEAAGTPIEGSKDDKFVVFDAYTAADGTISKIELKGGGQSGT